MLQRTYRVIKIGTKDELLIDFKDKNYEILSTFLESDVQEFENWIKIAFDKVLSGEVGYQECNGNVCCVEINPKATKIYDNLAEDGMGNWCEVDTKELRQIIEEWCDEIHKFKSEDNF